MQVLHISPLRTGQWTWFAFGCVFASSCVIGQSLALTPDVMLDCILGLLFLLASWYVAHDAGPVPLSGRIMESTRVCLVVEYWGRPLRIEDFLVSLRPLCYLTTSEYGSAYYCFVLSGWFLSFWNWAWTRSLISDWVCPSMQSLEFCVEFFHFYFTPNLKVRRPRSFCRLLLWFGCGFLSWLLREGPCPNVCRVNSTSRLFKSDCSEG